jgi:hypothetical protein
MTQPRFFRPYLGFCSGDWVEVKSVEEILSTLDDRGRLDALPFMPEMLQYCGKKFRVFKSAHKTCDTIRESKNRSMTASVHLEGLRCDGTAHGGCQAKCLLFWKEAWLRPMRGRAFANDPTRALSSTPQNCASVKNPCGLETLARASVVASDSGAQADVQYSCQATDLLQATNPLHWWQPQQYVKDLVSRNVQVRDFVRYWSIATFNVAMRSYSRLVTNVFSYSYTRKFIAMAQSTPALAVYGTQTEKAVACKTAEPFQRPTTPAAKIVHTGPTVVASGVALLRCIGRRIYNIGKQLNSHVHRYPYIRGLASGKTPSQRLDLEPGEWVQVRSIDEIRPTINRQRRNRGLKFDVEMVPYCGGTFRVLARVEKIINERTGRMMRLPNACVILEGVTCSGCFSQNRLFCPRSIYPYWHEIWLKRVE